MPSSSMKGNRVSCVFFSIFSLYSIRKGDEIFFVVIYFDSKQFYTQNRSFTLLYWMEHTKADNVWANEKKREKEEEKKRIT